MRLQYWLALLSTPAALLVTPASLPAAPPPADCAIKNFGELPVTVVDRQATVAVNIDGHDGRFAIHSGFYASQISSAAARKWSLYWRDAANITVGSREMGKSSDFRSVLVRRFTIAGLKLGHRDFIVTTGVSESEGTIGQDILSIADVEYDLPHGVIRLITPPQCPDTNFAYWAAGQPYSILDLERRDAEQPYIVGAVLLNGVKLRALFDSGYPATLVSLDAAAQAGIRPGGPDVTPLPDEGKMKRWVAPVASVVIGDEALTKTRIVIAELSRPDVDIVIGIDFFLAHRIYVANAARQMFFTHAGGKPFDVSGAISAHATLPPPLNAVQIRGGQMGNALSN